jgi:hypothetical protein
VGDNLAGDEMNFYPKLPRRGPFCLGKLSDRKMDYLGRWTGEMVVAKVYIDT